jgi:replicative DNA helicase
MLVEASLCEDLDVMPDHFYRSSHKMLLETIYELRAKGDGIDMVTVSEALKKSGKLDLVGGNSYIMGITKDIISPSLAKNHVKILKELSAKRVILQACRGVVAQIHDLEVDELLGNLNINIDMGTKNHVRTMKEVIKQVVATMDKRMTDSGEMSGIPTGFVKLDKMTDGLQGGNFIIVAARPGMGKSAFIGQIAKNACMSGSPSHIQSLEMGNNELATRIISENSGIPIYKIQKAMLRGSELSRMYDECGKLMDIPLTFDDKSMKIEDIRRGIHRAYKNGSRLVILDYIQLVDNSRSRVSREREVGEISTMCKQVAKQLDIPIIGVAQLSRSLESRENKRPILSDLRDSGQLEQDADIIIFIYRDGYYKKNVEDDTAELIVAKGRNIGTGTIHTGWHGQTTRFIDMEG